MQEHYRASPLARGRYQTIKDKYRYAIEFVVYMLFTDTSIAHTI